MAGDRQEGGEGRRDRNKRVKEAAIRAAAGRLFAERGYAQTTLRDVAREAGVGFGTVFGYASDKADLLAMVFVERLNRLPPLFAEDAAGDCAASLIAGLAHLYEFWAANSPLAEEVLRQLEFFRRTAHAEQILARRRALQAEVAAFLGRQRAAGRLAPDADPAEAAATCFAIYTSAVRQWAAVGDFDVPAGLAALRALLRLPLAALVPRPALRPVASGREPGSAPIGRRRSTGT